MKKLMLTVYTLYLLFFSILCFCDYSLRYQTKVGMDLVSFEIVKDKNLSNEDFVQKVLNVCKEEKIDLVYKQYNLEYNGSSRGMTSYYITNNDYTFLEKKYKELLEKNGKVSTLEQNKNRLKGSTFMGDVQFISFEEIKKYNLECCKYYVKDKDLKSIINKLRESGIVTNEINQITSVSKYVSLSNLLIPSLVLLIAMMFYFLSQKKEVMLKKMNGYSYITILKDGFFVTGKILGIVTTFIIFLNVVVINLIYKNIWVDYVAFLFGPIGVLIIMLYTLIILGHAIVALEINKNFIKGKNANREVYYLTIALEMILIVSSTLNSDYVVVGLSKIMSMYQSYAAIGRDVASYVVFPVNTSNTYIGEENQKEYNKILRSFYKDTVERFDGILIDTRNYRSVRGETTLAREYNQKDVTINENYLNLNPIYDARNQRVEDSSINYEKLNILVPEGHSEKEYRKYYQNYNLDKKDVNIIFYKKGTTLKTYNRYSGENGKITDPIIYFYNEKYFGEYMLNYVSGEYYMAKVRTKHPYEEFKNILLKHKLISVIPDTPYISNTFFSELAIIRNELINKISSLLIKFLGALVVIVYSISQYFCIYRKEIAVKLTAGYTLVNVYKRLILTQGILFLIVLCLMKIIHAQFHIVLLLVVGLLITIVCTIRCFQRKCMIAYIKGEE